MSKNPFDLSAEDAKHVKKLVKLMDETGLTEIEIEQNDVKIKLRKETSAVPTVLIPAASAEIIAPAAAPINTLTSPLVGTFYHSANPDAEPFIVVGSKVKKGQTVGIIEAMKTMNPVEADKAGTIKEILIANAQPVEFGQDLLVIE